MLRKLQNRYRINQMIRKAIDTCPDGLCFAQPDGRVILTNPGIQRICAELTGHTVFNANTTWQELSAAAISDLPADGSSAEEKESDNKHEASEEKYFRLKNGRIWRFQKCLLSGAQDPVVQYSASDVTELYETRRRLEANNRREAGLHERQRELLKNIVRNNLNEEMLNAKIRIHDEFGRLILMTRNAVSDPGAPSEIEALRRAWIKTVSAMESTVFLDHGPQPGPREELTRVAGLIGCSVVFDGAEPSEGKPLLLLYAAIREALTNAVRHAGADTLFVSVREEDGQYRARIRDNGATAVQTVREGIGLSGLRQRLEQARATLDYDLSDGFSMILTLPKE